MALQGLNDARHWRDRPTEERVLSCEMKDFEARTLMVRLANDYDKLADRAEDRRTTRRDLARERKAGNALVGGRHAASLGIRTAGRRVPSEGASNGKPTTKKA